MSRSSGASWVSRCWARQWAAALELSVGQAIRADDGGDQVDEAAHGIAGGPAPAALPEGAGGIVRPRLVARQVKRHVRPPHTSGQATANSVSGRLRGE